MIWRSNLRTRLSWSTITAIISIYETAHPQIYKNFHGISNTWLMFPTICNLRCNSLGAAPMERIESPRFLPPPLLDPSGWSIFIGGNELTAPCIRGTFHSGEGKFGERRKGKRTKPRCCIRNWIKRDKDNAMLENRESKRSKNRTEWNSKSFLGKEWENRVNLYDGWMYRYPLQTSTENTRLEKAPRGSPLRDIKIKSKGRRNLKISRLAHSWFSKSDPF